PTARPISKGHTTRSLTGGTPEPPSRIASSRKWTEMDNVTFTIKDNLLTILVDLRLKGEASKSGKTRVVASSRGNALIAPNTYLGLNVYRYEKENSNA